jgi:hypothetical protein
MGRGRSRLAERSEAKIAVHAAPEGACSNLEGGRYYKHGAPNGAFGIAAISLCRERNASGVQPERVHFFIDTQLP